MGERLRARDLAFLTGETPTRPAHNATVEIFDPGTSGFDHDTLTRLIADRIAFVPRYRQRVRRVPGHLANPVWADDPHFDLGLPRAPVGAAPPGHAWSSCGSWSARIVSRPLDRHRPLWEVYFVEGLEGGRVAVLTKAHQALVDGAQIVDLAQVLLDPTPERRELGADDWRPELPVTSAGLLVDAVRDSLASPATAVETARGVATSGGGAPTSPPVGCHVANALAGRRSDQDGPFGGHAVAAAPLRVRAPHARRAPRRPRRPRRHGQRRRPRDRHRRAAQLADDADGVARRAAPGARGRPDVGPRP